MLRNGVRLLAGDGVLVVRATILCRDMAELAIVFPTKTYTFPRTARVVHRNAFIAQGQLESVRLNEGLEILEEGCFTGVGIRTLAVPASLRSIGASAFSKCQSLERVDFGAARDLRLERRAFFFCQGLRHVRFGSGVKSIGHSCFLENGLEEVVLPPIQTVREYTFCGCESLRRVAFAGDGPRSIGKNAFAGSGLEEFVAPPALCRVSEAAFFSCHSLKCADFGACAPDGGDFIQREAFRFSALESVVFPLGLRAVGECAFVDCRKLRSVAFAGRESGKQPSLENIGNMAFGGCCALGDFRLPDGVRELGWLCFWRTGLAGLKVPEQVRLTPEQLGLG